MDAAYVLPATHVMPPAAQRDARDAALLELARIVKAEGYRFVTVSPATHARVNKRAGNEWATRLEDVLGWSRPFGKELLPRSVFDLLHRAEALEPHGEGWRSLIRVSSLNDKLFIHSAYPTTASDAVFFGPDTYRFISALEEHVARSMQPIRRAADIGCGAGPGAISMALHSPDAEVIGVDINARALRYTAINAALAGTENVSAMHSDLLTGVAGEFDLIIANPPYLLDSSERTYRHGGGHLGEGLSVAIIRQAMQRLALGGSLLLYTGVAIVNGQDQFRSIAQRLLDGSGLDWSYREIDPDVFGEELEEPAYNTADRIAAVVLTVTRRD
ncbi:methylase of polypeptide subunit release factors [Paucimonas lemoignei]|uniref:Methylase of polypeptide subunit release factors n=1 Tax=Paucimonas lemoignei TaxID=29443 RepID=A0A4R3I2Y1_PAULE|nr:methyltransferase [Paucimonas lemoignei]TCS39393.1 methylase of polypeptide subunit release factors [Paucimonas lemoignei]